MLFNIRYLVTYSHTLCYICKVRILLKQENLVFQHADYILSLANQVAERIEYPS